MQSCSPSPSKAVHIGSPGDDYDEWDGGDGGGDDDNDNERLSRTVLFISVPNPNLIVRLSESYYYCSVTLRVPLPPLAEGPPTRSQGPEGP